MIGVLSGSGKGWSKLVKPGFDYDRKYYEFTRIAEEYIESLIEFQWTGEWPYAYENLDGFEVFVRKLLRKIGFSKATEFLIYHSSPSEEEFLAKTRVFLDNLVCGCNLSNTGIHTSVIHNALEPFFCGDSRKYFSDFKQIVVDRDPRDVYLSAKNYSKGGKNGWSSTTTDGVEGFIAKYKSMKKNEKNQEHDSKLKVYFEDLVLSYDESRSRIFDFLGVDESHHMLEKKKFDPSKSKEGVGMWRLAEGDLKMEVEKIAKELKQYCIDL